MTPALKARHIAALLERAVYQDVTEGEVERALRWLGEVKEALSEIRSRPGISTDSAA